MARSQDSFNKKEKEKKRQKRKKEKFEQRMQRKSEKAESGGKTFEEMLAYVDEDGNLTTEKPDPLKKRKIVAADIILGASPREPVVIERVRTGRVKFFNDEKGYGFIIDDVTKNTLFVHINNVSEPIGENDHVQFEVEMGPKGPNAVLVQKYVEKPKPIIVETPPITNDTKAEVKSKSEEE